MADIDSPRLRLAVAVIWAFAIAALQSWPLAVALALVALACAWRAVPPARLAGPLALAAGLFVFFAIGSGAQAMLHLGPVVIHADGLSRGALIAARLVAIVGVALALLGPLTAAQLARGLRGLHVPRVIADMTLLTLRYLDEARAEIARADLARSLRGGGKGWCDLSDRGMILAASLIRAQARAERLWTAMRLRGHDRAVPVPRVSLSELCVILGALCMAAALVVLDRAP